MIIELIKEKIIANFFLILNKENKKTVNPNLLMPENREKIEKQPT